MNTFIALFRGINVGGKNIVPMKELISVLEDLGLRDVKTYMQSGNVVFRSSESDVEELSDAIRAAIGKSHGFTPHVLILTKQELHQAIARNPFPEGESEPKTLHLFFLQSILTNPDMDRLETIKTGNERFRLIDAVFFLHAPDGIGRSKLAANVEKAMGVQTTARNWRSVNKVMSMATELGA